MHELKRWSYLIWFSNSSGQNVLCDAQIRHSLDTHHVQSCPLSHSWAGMLLVVGIKDANNSARAIWQHMDHDRDAAPVLQKMTMKRL